MDRDIKEIAEIYDSSDFARLQDTNYEIKHLRQWLYQKMGVLSGKEIIFIGCGDAKECIPAFYKGAAVTGVDLSEKLTKAAQMNIPNGLFYNYDYRKMPKKLFDILISINTLNYEEDLVSSFSKYKTFLKNSGLAYICIPHPFYKAVKYNSSNYFWEGKKYYSWNGLERFNQFHTVESYLNSAISSGFQIVNLSEVKTPKNCRSYDNQQLNIPIFLVLTLRK